jgi:hypothetical protein
MAMVKVPYTVDNVIRTIDVDIKETLTEALKLSKCFDPWKVSADDLMKHGKKAELAECVESMAAVLAMCRDMMKGALGDLDDLKSQQISLQKQIIDQQSELLKCKDEQLDSVQATVKTEMRSYADHAAKNWPQQSAEVVTPDQVKQAVKVAVQEEDRTRSLMMFGVKEEENEEEIEQTVLEIMATVDEKPRLAECCRLGGKVEGKVRPIKVTLYSADTVQRVLRKGGRLMKSENHREVFLAADRSEEERTARRELVVLLKEKRAAEPKKLHFIRNNEIISRDLKETGE